MPSDDLPQVPRHNLKLPDLPVRDMKPGERGVVMKSFAVHVDKNLHAWIDGDATLMGSGPLAGLAVAIERTERGFILWLDKKDTFTPEKRLGPKQWIPVIELRDAEEK